ncbi:Zinc metalloproteinase nas-14 [Orchesella cincta]|uniref:Metalloendopeptidase n=1 Tax=Orchesella cincta TaxID=48709 RepID=A0A1D2MP11_ORCCI|nr:Zinc metalloproteinase nas-14 [Orchesella cincta]
MFSKPILPHQIRSFRKLDSLSTRNTTRVRYNDGTSKAKEFYQIDDMLFLNPNKSKQHRAGQYRESYRWATARIPYTFGPGYSEDEMRQIFFTMKYIEQYTCVRFAFRTERDDNYLYIRNVEGKCQSFVGNVRPSSFRPESRSCAVPNFPGHVLHELIHALGFFHEHARDDRDNYIEIVYDNLSEDDDILRNFYKNSDSDITTAFHTTTEVLCTTQKAGSINGDATIIRRAPLPQGIPKPLDGEMGQRERLTEGDAQMIRNMYKDICPMIFSGTSEDTPTMFLVKNFRLVLVLLGLIAVIGLSFADEPEEGAGGDGKNDTNPGPTQPTPKPGGTSPTKSTTGGQTMVGPSALLLLLAAAGPVIQYHYRKLSPTSA